MESQGKNQAYGVETVFPLEFHKDQIFLHLIINRNLELQ